MWGGGLSKADRQTYLRRTSLIFAVRSYSWKFSPTLLKKTFGKLLKFLTTFNDYDFVCMPECPAHIIISASGKTAENELAEDECILPMNDNMHPILFHFLKQ